MPNFAPDDWIDAQLRDVSVPQDLLARLAETPVEADAGDHLAMLAGGATSGDPRLDVLLRDVPVPARLEGRLLRIARHGRPAPAWLRFGLAASLFIALGLGATAYVGLITGALGPGSSIVVEKQPSADAPDGRTPSVGVASRGRQQRPLHRPKHEARTSESSIAQATPNEAPATPPAALAIMERMGELGSWFEQAVEEHRRAAAALGASGHFERLPALDALEMPAIRGMAPPLVHGYDQLFHLKHGEHPFTAPGAHKDLMSTRVPLVFGTTSYDLALRGLSGGAMPAPDEIHVEDFLAAQRFALHAAQPGELALHLAAAPSPLAEPGLYMMQVAVQGGPNALGDHPPTRLLVLIDTSSAMRGEARWEMALRSLDQVARQMAPADRMTLIGFAEQPQMLAENATSDQLRTLLASDNLAAPAGSADLPAAIHVAAELASALPAGHRCRLMFITAGRQQWSESALEGTGADLAGLAAADTPWQVVRLTSGDGDDGWATLAELGHGEISTAATATELHHALAMKLIGRSSRVATHARLKLIFNPRIVTGYRLLGHVSPTLTGSPGDAPEVELDADDLATGMFELWIKPDGGDEIAAAELTWQAPTSGQQRRQVHVLKRRQIATSFAKAAPWLQHGMIAAKTAEALRGSFFVSGQHAVAQLLTAASQVNERVAEQPDFQALVALLRQAEKRR